jgi:GTP-binding protein EngB required for normal cell division
MKTLQEFANEGLSINESVTVVNKKTGNIYDVEKLNPKTQKPYVSDDDAKSDDNSNDKKLDTDDFDWQKYIDDLPTTIDDKALDDIDEEIVKPKYRKAVKTTAEEYLSKRKKLAELHRDEEFEIEEDRKEAEHNLSEKRKLADSKLARERAAEQNDARKNLSAEDFKQWLANAKKKWSNEDTELANARQDEDRDIAIAQDKEDKIRFDKRRKEDNSLKSKMTEAMSKAAKNTSDSFFSGIKSFLSSMWND